MDATEMFVQALMAELHMICETWKDTHDF